MVPTPKSNTPAGGHTQRAALAKPTSGRTRQRRRLTAMLTSDSRLGPQHTIVWHISSKTTRMNGVLLWSIFAFACYAPSCAVPQFVQLESADEGMSSWRHVICEYFAIALRWNATVAEPCVVSGRIQPCSSQSQPLSALFSFAMIRMRFQQLRIVSHSTFSSLTEHIP